MTEAAPPPVSRPVPTAPPSPERFALPASEERVQQTVQGLESRGMHAIVVDTRAQASEAVLRLVPPGAEVMDATSQTLATLGIPEALADPERFHGIRAELSALRAQGDLRAMRKLGAAPDVVVGSVHAITESGQVVIASATGSQLAPYAYGAGQVIWVVGTQKIVTDLDEAFERIEQHTLPLESARAQRVYGMGSTIAKHLIVHREVQPGRITIVLVREALGF
jgi:hypothetical protein